MGDFTDTECEKYNVFFEQHKLSDDENDCFIELMYSGMPYKTCEKTILEARAKHSEPDPEPHPEPHPVFEPEPEPEP
tara:strand:+ start:966 stop:1196 length:231 start_codon:yes stop_codon:yes gene_type:complete